MKRRSFFSFLLLPFVPLSWFAKLFKPSWQGAPMPEGPTVSQQHILDLFKEVYGERVAQDSFLLDQFGKTARGYGRFGGKYWTVPIASEDIE